MIGDTFVFDYPIEFTTLPEYTQHRGHYVTVLRELEDGVEYDFEGLKMYEVRSQVDGWVGHAYESELVLAHDVKPRYPVMPDFLPPLPDAPEGKHWEYCGVCASGLVGVWAVCRKSSNKWVVVGGASFDYPDTHYAQLVDDATGTH